MTSFIWKKVRKYGCYQFLFLSTFFQSAYPKECEQLGFFGLRCTKQSLYCSSEKGKAIMANKKHVLIFLCIKFFTEMSHQKR